MWVSRVFLLILIIIWWTGQSISLIKELFEISASLGWISNKTLSQLLLFYKIPDVTWYQLLWYCFWYCIIANKQGVMFEIQSKEAIRRSPCQYIIEKGSSLVFRYALTCKLFNFGWKLNILTENRIFTSKFSVFEYFRLVYISWYLGPVSWRGSV